MFSWCRAYFARKRYCWCWRVHCYRCSARHLLLRLAIWRGARQAIVWRIFRALGGRSIRWGIIMPGSCDIASWVLLAGSILRARWRRRVYRCWCSACCWRSRCCLLLHLLDYIFAKKQATACALPGYNVDAGATLRAIVLLPHTGSFGGLVLCGRLWTGLVWWARHYRHGAWWLCRCSRWWLSCFSRLCGAKKEAAIWAESRPRGDSGTTMRTEPRPTVHAKLLS